MKKNCFYIGFLTVFFLCALLLSAGLLISGPAQASANEQVAPLPILYTPEEGVNQSFLSELIDYVNDNFFLRREMITLDRWLSANVLRTSNESGVLLGKKDWLFYADTLPDYTGTSPMSRHDLYNAAQNLSLMAQYCEDNEKQFAFLPAPNKNTLYGQYMTNYGVTGGSRLDWFLDLLESRQVNTVNLISAFRSQEEVLYFAHDSHWNSKGAALGADCINAAFGRPSDYFAADFSTATAHSGDLYEMLFPAFTDTETNPQFGGTLSYTFTSKATRPDAILLTTQSESNGSILVYRDSFGNLLYPYLADSYGDARFSRSTTYDLTLDTEYVLIELVERNLSYLVKNIPLMPSPVCSDAPDTTASGLAVVASAESKGDFTQIAGVLPMQPDTDTAIYVSSEGTLYRAFCLENNGFGVNLPKGSTADAVYCTVSCQTVQYNLTITD